MRVSKLLKTMFEFDRWQELINHATEKGIRLDVLHEYCFEEKREKLFADILSNQYNIFPPHIARIPKDKPGEFREVYVNEALDRIVLTLINDCLCDLFKDMVHPNCKSYQKGTSTQKVVLEVSQKIVSLNKQGIIGYKSDFSKYFDTVNIEVIDNIFDVLEKRLGFKKGTEPVLNLLRRYYHQDLYFNLQGKLEARYQGLKQGCAVASFLANACLYELDEYMANKYEIYYRYSDDTVVIDNHVENVITDMNNIISKYGVTLNPKKVEPLYSDKWFKFLGFLIKGNQITLSGTRVKKFQKEVEKRSIKRRKCSSKQAKNAITKFLYEGEFNWATSCLSIINVEKDINELNSFIMDCIRACETGKKKIGGLGSVTNLPDKTILRGTGRNVKSNKAKTGYIEKYISVGCLAKDVKLAQPVFETVVRNMWR